MITRRSFIKNSAMLGTGLLIRPDIFFEKRVKKIGLQLYTLRNVLNQNNVVQVIEKIATIGYRELEIFGYTKENKFWGLEPKPFKKLLKENNLSAPAAHISFENFLTGKNEEEFKMICEAAKAVGNDYIIVAWLDEKYRKTANDYKKIAGKLNEAGAIAKQYGLQLAYHNHDFELIKLDNETTGYDIIVKNTDKELLQLELDLYWATKAGKDPVQLFTENPGRFPLLHIKDMDKQTGDFTEAGQGIIDFKRIFAYQETAGLQHIFIEQDEVKKDVFESIEESFRYIKKNMSWLH
jgi:sugar phosphate isomerase/epimerase